MPGGSRIPLAIVTAAAAAVFTGPLAAAIIVAAAVVAGVLTAPSRRGSLTALALLWAASTITAGWLWRVGFLRADAGLPSLPWTNLWLPLAVMAVAAMAAFAGLYGTGRREAGQGRP